MPNLAATLKAEVSRLARKEVRSETEGLRKTVIALRTELSATRKRLRDLEGAVQRAAKAGARGRPAPATSKAIGAGEKSAADADTKGFRFSAKGLASNRQRLGLSTADYGRLVGATGQAVAGWEKGTNRPRAKYLSAIAELRGIGKREVAKRLEAAAEHAAE